MKISKARIPSEEVLARIHSLSEKKGTIAVIEPETGDYFLGNSLTEAFLHDPDEYVRSQSVWALASTDAEYTAELMVNQLDKSEDPVAQNIAVSELSAIGDPRVIPTFAQRLENSAIRKDAAFALARFKDKRAVPALTEMLRIVDWKVWADYPWEYRDAAEHAMEALVQIGDESSIPILLKMLDSPLKESVARVLPDFGAPIVPPLLEMMKQAHRRRFETASPTC